MKAVRELLRDRRRSQRGSVLSGVLIMTAYVAIIAGAVMTELSTNFLLSTSMVNRVANQATVNSAMELGLNRLGTTAISGGCPSLSSATVNGKTAAASYINCVPVVDSRSPGFIAAAVSSSRFDTNAYHAVIPQAAQNLYLVGDAAGHAYQFNFGGTRPVWVQNLGAPVSAAPRAYHDGSGQPDDLVNLFPLGTSGSPPTGCELGGCVAMLGQNAGFAPVTQCYMRAFGPVDASPAIGAGMPTVAYFGDRSGEMFAYDAVRFGNCALEASAPSSGQPVVAGPIVFAGPASGSTVNDEVYAVTSDGTTSRLVRYEATFRNNKPTQLTQIQTWSLSSGTPVGIAVDGSTLPARIAITYSNGSIEIARIQTSFSVQVLATGAVASAIDDAPYWCQCPAGTDVIAVGAANGSLYLLDTSLSVIAALPAGGPAIRTSPAGDGVGDWFFGADDGYVYEVQQSGSRLAVVESFGQLNGAVGSATIVGSCPAGLCIYAGTTAGAAYTVQLDARDVILSACVSTAPPACSGEGPRLWASVEVGSASSPATVHVKGWAYYSP